MDLGGTQIQTPGYTYKDLRHSTILVLLPFRLLLFPFLLLAVLSLGRRGFGLFAFFEALFLALILLRLWLDILGSRPLVVLIGRPLL